MEERSCMHQTKSVILTPPTTTFAIYDSRVDVGGFFVSPDMLRDRNPRRSRRITESFSNTTLFVSIEGVQESNAFTLSTSFGDNCKCLHSIHIVTVTVHVVYFDTTWIEYYSM